MRVLCLHGMGTNARIFAQQTEAFRALLSPQYEFVFIDGPVSCTAAPEVADFFPDQKYLCWYNTPSADKVAAAHKHILNVIKTNGPFDAVMGFSQGAALAASMILHGLTTPAGAPLFRAAIFICSPLPFSSNLWNGIDTRRYFGSPAHIPNPVREDCPTKIPDYLVTDPRYLRGEEYFEEHEKSGSESDSEESSRDSSRSVSPVPSQAWYQMFHHTSDEVRIRIPTVNIIGLKDQWRLHSKDVSELCDKSDSTVFEHSGGHEIPRYASEEICDLVEDLFLRC